jgi:hypothetical protein
VVLASPSALTSNSIRDEKKWNVYEWSGGRLQLVNVLPDGKPAREGLNATLGGQSTIGEAASGSVARAVSNDGRRIAWTWGQPYVKTITGEFRYYRGLYVRDMVEGRTLRVGGRKALLQTMNSDGSRIFFLEEGELYEFNFATDTQTDLTANHGADESNAGVKELVSDVSEDGSSVYFVATGVLAKGAVSDGDNLYLLHDDGSGWSTRYIATLSSEDEKSWFSSHRGDEGSPGLPRISSRVSPDGRYLTFMSNRQLTGYDNTDAVSGQPDEEVYLYDAASNRLACASCNPSGARPVGVLDEGEGQLLVDRLSPKVWGELDAHWLAGSVPGWDISGGGLETGSYQPRYLSNSGRLFFDSPDALVPQDTNGLEDVYQYEPDGVGGCVSTNTTFSERSGGCVDLISSGKSSAESVFYDASENGDDVFFLTASRLTTADYDTSLDVYDAHVCSTWAPCIVAPVSPPPCTSGDSCKAAPSPQPEIFGPAPSATFSGTGNVVEEAKKGVVKGKGKTKRKKHAKAKQKRRKGKKAKRSGAGRASKKGKR